MDLKHCLTKCLVELYQEGEILRCLLQCEDQNIMVISQDGKMDMEYSELAQRGHEDWDGNGSKMTQRWQNENTILGEALAAIVKTVLFVAGGLVGGLGTRNWLSWG
jgi:hypothetical protein